MQRGFTGLLPSFQRVRRESSLSSYANETVRPSLKRLLPSFVFFYFTEFSGVWRIWSPVRYANEVVHLHSEQARRGGGGVQIFSFPFPFFAVVVVAKSKGRDWPFDG